MIVSIVPKIIQKSIFSSKKMALSPIAEKGTRKIKPLTSLAPNVSIPIKYIVVAKVVARIEILKIFNQNIPS